MTQGRLDFESAAMIRLQGRMGAMNRILRVAAVTLIAAVILPRVAAADYWARLDRPWTSAEVSKAVAFCRLQPALGPDVRLFVDQLMGQQIQNCMYALGWIAVAR
jgi:hypothetical protein